MNEDAIASKVPFWQVTPAIEFICWVATALAPILRLINGPPVTDDQAFIQIALLVMAMFGALGFRLYNWRNRERWRKLLASGEGEDSFDIS